MTTYSHEIRTNRYSLNVLPGKAESKITMQLHTPKVTTTGVAGVITVLKKYVPTIFRCHCDNGCNNSFETEAASTEIGHLYEHILLEYLVALKAAQAKRAVTISGLTSWDWTKDPIGTFHITIELDSKDALLLFEAVRRSNRVLEEIMSLACRYSQ